MKKIVSLIIPTLILGSYEIFSQGESRFWYFGRKAGLDFSTNPPTMLGNGAQNYGDVDEGHATISDKNGNLLFYTNGMTIWNRNHAPMPNGTGLMGHWSSTQCATIFPVPGSSTQYYVITSPVTGSTDRYRWNIIDMTLNGGLGDIKTPVASNKNQILPSCPTYVMEALTSVPHANGTDIWVIGHTADDPSTGSINEGGSFLVWLVTSSGITFSASYTLGYAYPQNAGVSRGIGIMKSNSCFTRLAISYYNESSRFEVFSFNNSTGAVGNMPAPINAPLVLTQFRDASGNMVPISQYAYGVEFSPNGRFLYGTISGEIGPKNIFQYDLQAGGGTNADIQNSCVRLTPTTPAGVRYGMLQLGPDGRIYHTLHQWNAIGFGGYCQVGAILNPNNAGLACNYNESFLIWPNTFVGVGSTMGLPSFHKGFLAGSARIKSPSVSSLDEVCAGEPISFEADYIGSAVNFKWDINKNVSPGYEFVGPGFSNTPNVTYSTPGLYDVELVVTDNCGYEVTTLAKIKVNPVITPTGTVTCNPPQATFTATSPLHSPTNTFVWYRNSSGLGGAIGQGSSITINFGNNSSGSLWLQEVGSATTNPTTAGVISNLTSPEAPSQNSSTPRITSLSIFQTLTLNSFQFRAEGCWGCTADLLANYIINIKNASNVIVWSGNITNYNINKNVGSDPAPATVTPNVTLHPGNYTIEIIHDASTDGPYHSSRAILPLNSLSGNSLDGVITNLGSGGSTSFIRNINFTYSNTTVTSQLVCSKITKIDYNCPLPVYFVAVTVKQLQNQNLIEWGTATESNNAYFEILHSNDGEKFETIGKIPGKGNSNFYSHYFFSHKNFNIGINYYKIKQVDLDGNIAYSNPVVAYNLNSNTSITLSPNPNNGQFTIYSNYKDQPDKNKYLILDTFGRIIRNGTFSDQIHINLQNEPKGIYTVIVNEQILKTIVF